ncbi:MAG: tetratricopeptide repeat protein [Myxococcota bacterium]
MVALLAALTWITACGGDVESRMAEVRALQDVGQFESSIEELREILAVSPDLAEANYRLGLALVQTGEASRAVWPLQKASESSEYAITAGLLLASTHLQTKNYDESVRAANRVLEADPDRVAALRVRAMANLVGRKLDAALEDTERLKELSPDDYAVRALHATVLGDIGRHEEAEKEHEFVKQLGQESDDPNLRIRACLAPAVFASEVLLDTEKAKPLYEDCARRNPTDLVTLNHIAGFFDKIGEPDRATEMVQASVEAAPESLPLRTTLAARLQARGDAEGAERVLREAVDSFGSAQAWSALANFYRGMRRTDEALEAIEKVRELSGGGGEQLRFTHADILLDARDIEGAKKVAAEIQQPAYSSLLQGRILLLSGDPAGALAAFEKGINAWPNNAGARYLAGLAARDLGDYERAKSEFREAVRSGQNETDASLELARILLAEGKYAEAVTFTLRAAAGPAGSRPDPYVLGARGFLGQGKPERARASLTRARSLGFVPLAVSEQAILERQVHGSEEAALAFIDDQDLDLADPENLPVLQQKVESLTALGRTTQANQAIDAALAVSPDSNELYELRGLAAGRAGDAAAAVAAFEKAIELDAESAAAHAGLATVTANAGDLARGVELFDRAYALDPTNGVPAYSAAQITLVTGDRSGAIERLRQVVKHHPEVVGARNDLAFLLAEDGDELDLALSLAQGASERDPSPEVLDTLGWVRLQRGEAEEAVEAFELAAAGRPDSDEIRSHLEQARAALARRTP